MSKNAIRARRIPAAPLKKAPATGPAARLRENARGRCWSCGDVFTGGGVGKESPAKPGICSFCYTDGVGED